MAHAGRLRPVRVGSIPAPATYVDYIRTASGKQVGRATDSVPASNRRSAKRYLAWKVAWDAEVFGNARAFEGERKWWTSRNTDAPHNIGVEPKIDCLAAK